ncbi:distal tail protein Dit [Candidatus Enterococcus ferrettii]|uniref:distal tail protein Dit n=1 Tax=Candidatus Enterococcus ferrettii TaxID=2815324 RepID=UPI003D2FDD75
MRHGRNRGNLFRIKEGIIEVPFVIQGDLHTAHDEMMRILNVDEPKKLQFSDQMDRYYLAISARKAGC